MSTRLVLAAALSFVGGASAVFAQTNTYYVDGLAGNDDEGTPGTMQMPFKTIQRAVNKVVPGDTILVRGKPYFTGRYLGPTDPDVVIEGKHGTPSQTYKLWAYEDEVPVIDGQYATYRGAVRLSGSSYWHLRGLEIVGDAAVEGPPNALSGIVIDSTAPTPPSKLSHHNVIESCVVHGCSRTGIHIETSNDNTVLNCDSYENSDERVEGVWGEHADGFGVKFSSRGNRLMGCRSWRNSDDGFDFWESYGVVATDCASWNNGRPQFQLPEFEGDGFGFKLGQLGEGHTLARCFAWDNAVNGFASHFAAGPCQLINCTAFRNGRHNFVITATSAEPHLLVNNVSIEDGGRPQMYDQLNGVESLTNSWELTGTSSFIPVTTFRSLPPLDDTYAPARGVAGLFDDLDLFRPQAASVLIDVGTQSRPSPALFFVASRPDLGAIETVAPAPCMSGLELRVFAGAEVQSDLAVRRRLDIVAEEEPVATSLELFVGQPDPGKPCGAEALWGGGTSFGSVLGPGPTSFPVGIWDKLGAHGHVVFQVKTSGSLRSPNVDVTVLY